MIWSTYTADENGVSAVFMRPLSTYMRQILNINLESLQCRFFLPKLLTIFDKKIHGRYSTGL